MAVRDDFSAGEVLAAADLNDTFAEKLPYSYGTATPTTSDDGFLWYDSNSTPPAPKFWDGSAFQALGGGKILQVVRATDGTERTTTSTSFVDASISVTITPQKSTSAILIIWAAYCAPDNNTRNGLRITDNSNNSISGAQTVFIGTTASTQRFYVSLFAYSTPATTSATTYKGRFRTIGSGSAVIENQNATGQMYAIEVSA